MSETTVDRAGYVAALPTFAQCAAMIGIHPSGIGRAVSRLGIEPIRWGNRDKHLSVRDLLRLADDANREAVETVAQRLLEHVVREHPAQVDAIQAEVDALLTQASVGTEAKPAGATHTRTDSHTDGDGDSHTNGDGEAHTDTHTNGDGEAHTESGAAHLRGPVEPATARRLVALYTRPSGDEGTGSG